MSVMACDQHSPKGTARQRATHAGRIQCAKPLRWVGDTAAAEKGDGWTAATAPDLSDEAASICPPSHASSCSGPSARCEASGDGCLPGDASSDAWLGDDAASCATRRGNCALYLSMLGDGVASCATRRGNHELYLSMLGDDAVSYATRRGNPALYLSMHRNVRWEHSRSATTCVPPQITSPATSVQLPRPCVSLSVCGADPSTQAPTQMHVHLSRRCEPSVCLSVVLSRPPKYPLKCWSTFPGAANHLYKPLPSCTGAKFVMPVPGCSRPPPAPLLERCAGAAPPAPWTRATGRSAGSRPSPSAPTPRRRRAGAGASRTAGPPTACPAPWSPAQRAQHVGAPPAARRLLPCPFSARCGVVRPLGRVRFTSASPLGLSKCWHRTPLGRADQVQSSNVPQAYTCKPPGPI
jgi:hypothetical protein